jgi:hypothetical protein
MWLVHGNQSRGSVAVQVRKGMYCTFQLDYQANWYPGSTPRSDKKSQFRLLLVN